MRFRLFSTATITALIIACGCAAAPCYAENEIRIGILPVYSYLEIYKRSKPLRDYLQSRCGVTVVSKFFKNMDDYYQNARTGTIDLLYLNPSVYIKLAPKAGSRETGIEAIARIINENDNDKFRGSIATRAGHPQITQATDIALPGLKGMCTSRISAAGFTSQKLYFSALGIDIDKLNLMESPTQQHETVILAIIEGEVDYGFFREDAPDL
ncbi:MAG: phosphate/phosphite/phosphonate ABC transporter substrate-binding protein, partial [Candidatus Omnitrophica bacterium]|nr:phosphate/phosphite/phosphonate ABC transporter substrate-binding protein [Candidatus Omnitrophota bacterium]